MKKSFFNQFSSRSSNATGSFLFISFISKAWWFTLSNALLRSILHKLTVLPPLTKRSTTWRTVKIAWLQPIPSLKPNCLLSVEKNSPNFSIKQYSNNFDIIGLIAIPRKSSQDQDSWHLLIFITKLRVGNHSAFKI